MTRANGQSDRLDRVETLLSQMAEQSTADRQAANERITRIEQQVDEEAQLWRERLAELTEITVDFMSATRESVNRLDQTILRLDQTVVELRAGQEQHSRMLDVLIRNQQNGEQNGG